MTERVRVVVRGAVQGVGFRPFVYRLATSLALGGWVRNAGAGVVIEAEGSRPDLDRFLTKLEQEPPARASIQSLERTFLEPAGHEAFAIAPSDGQGSPGAWILPDLATCADCLREMFAPGNRRYRHPFINCTSCGPRFSIIEALPYDRPKTSMKRFPMCRACEAEYRDPADRRFHAQPISCPQCGPRLWACEGSGRKISEAAVECAAEAIRQGRIVALKGIGGFQLLVDARDDQAVRRLRARKHREGKPFAVMVPGREAVEELCEVSAAERRLLASPQGPIVLLTRRAGPGIAPSVAPRHPTLGVMLPYSPLHHLLMAELGFPVVATSGNLTGEPLCIDEGEALERLGEVADLFVIHDRSIVRPLDDSVVRVMLGRDQVLRRARGYAPFPVHLKNAIPPVLAVGGHLKSAIALGIGQEVFLGQHLGDLETVPAREAFLEACADLPRLYGVSPERIACDLHPDYPSTRFAQERPERLVMVPHHRAHVLACMADNELEPPVLGVAWDGTGFGEDGTIWGGEFLLEEGTTFRRLAHLHPFRLPGGEAAIRDPRRSALGVLVAALGEEGLAAAVALRLWEAGAPDLALLRSMLSGGVQAPLTTSAGRLFDAVAVLAGWRGPVSFEGQAAVELEFAAAETTDSYPFHLDESIVDWRPMLRMIVDEARSGQSMGVISGKFHRTLAAMVCAVAERVGQADVVLTGGCFQNRLLTEICVRALRERGFRPAWHQRVPPNDGGIALGQVLAAAQTP